MKKFIPRSLRYIVLVTLLFTCGRVSASHLVGMDLNYTWDSGNVYTIRVVAYGNCGTTTGAFETLPYSSPQVCVFNGDTYVTTLNLVIDSSQSFVEVTPVCSYDSLLTQCTNTSYAIPGIKKYTYTIAYTVPSQSRLWRFVYTGGMGAGSGAGRAASITNIIYGASGTITALVDTLNNTVANHHNSNPDLTVLPVPFFCDSSNDNYNPGAVDVDGDSLSFFLVPGLNGTESCPGAPSYTYGDVTYTGTGTSASEPMTIGSAVSTFAFSEATGQISFRPIALQRDLVVYNVEEYRRGSTGDTLVGTSQREMTFTILPCSNKPPSASIDSMTGLGVIDDSTHYHICSNSGPFTISLDPAESDTSNIINVTYGGLPVGAGITITNNGTNHPHVSINWTSTGTTFGAYTFYLTLTDNNCPLEGQQTLAYTISIYPAPTVSLAVLDPATCVDPFHTILAVASGNLGMPWSMYNETTGALLTTIGSAADSGSIEPPADTLVLAPGNYYLNTYSALSTTTCYATDTLLLPPPILPTPPDVITEPNFCGNNTGAITLNNLSVSGDTVDVKYQYNGTWVSTARYTIVADSQITIANLCAGVYDSLIVTYQTCVTNPIGPLNLDNPPFVPLRMDTTNPTACGYRNGIIKILGLVPGQTDTVNYDYQPLGSGASTAQPPVISFVGPDSTLKMLDLGAGIYTNIVVSTAGNCNATAPDACVSSILGPMTLTAPNNAAGFTFNIDYGCNSDTVVFSNTSTAPSSPVVFYKWFFGDGTMDTATAPSHVFTGKDTTYGVILTMTNTECFDTVTANVELNNFVTVGFTSNPDSFACQGDSVSFTNISMADTAYSYTWYFGDGATSTLTNPTHTFANIGTYEVMLVLNNFVPCSDTAIELLSIDSNTQRSIALSDTVFCAGSSATYTGSFAITGLENITWAFGDGVIQQNANPVTHSYASPGVETTTLTVTYRACPTKTDTATVNVLNTPEINLGPDTAICEGGPALYLTDNINAGNTAATWLWNTGATTSGISVTAAGYYYTTVTIGGCSATDSVWVANDCYVNIPNVFTPNNDGTNDYFFPRDYLTKGLIQFNMTIYNRWGQEIFQTSTLDGRGWDGKFNGSPQPEGVYIYIIDATFKDGQKEHHQGNVTLLR